MRSSCLGTVLLLICSGAMASGKPLFLGQASYSPQAAAAVANTADRPTTEAMQVLLADAAVVSPQTREIEIQLGSRRITAVQSQVQVSAQGSTIWSGEIEGASSARRLGVREIRNDMANSVILVRRGDGITGSLRVDGQLYRIHPLGDGTHALIRVDESAMPPEHPPAFDYAPQIDMSRVRVRQAVIAAAAATSTIRVQVVATQDAISAYGGDMEALAELAVAETNQGYQNAGVDINMQLSNYRTVNYNSVGFDTDLARFRSTNDGYFDDIHSSRDANGADVNVLIVNDSAYCGLASSIGANASTAFAAVYWDCATGYYSFGHEIGHLQSARHDPSTDSTNSPYAYGHGYWAASRNWRTIMAYSCGSGCTRLNYWSNPNRTYQGEAMGTSNRSDNHRVLENTRATIAAFRGGGSPPPGGGSQAYTNGTNYTINDNATVESPVAVSGRSGNAPSSTQVRVDIKHTYIGDLRVQLVAPDGSLYTLSNRTGGSTDNINKTYTVNLSSEARNGTWKLRVNDNANGDTGYIDSWSVTF